MAALRPPTRAVSRSWFRGPRATFEGPPLLVLLLPGVLERLPEREPLETLLRAPGAVAVEPARVSYGALTHLPASLANMVARRQARRMQLPGVPAVVAVLHPLQVPLAGALVRLHPAAELWYGAPPGAVAGERAEALDAIARAGADAELALPLSGRLWTRMESLGIESGRLGSERLA
jgi:hypothetical protein